MTLIIHNAWKLDFNISLLSFESHIKSARNLIDLALASHLDPRVFFMSSIGVVEGWKERGPVPEEPIDDPRISVGGGYGEGKYVVEKVSAALPPFISLWNSAYIPPTADYGGSAQSYRTPDHKHPDCADGWWENWQRCMGDDGLGTDPHRVWGEDGLFARCGWSEWAVSSCRGIWNLTSIIDADRVLDPAGYRSACDPRRRAHLSVIHFAVAISIRRSITLHTNSSHYTPPSGAVDHRLHAVRTGDRTTLWEPTPAHPIC